MMIRPSVSGAVEPRRAASDRPPSRIAGARRRAGRRIASWLFVLLLAGAEDVWAGVVGVSSDEAPPWLRAMGDGAVVYAQTEPPRAAEIVRNLERFRAMFARLAPDLSLNSPVPTKIFAFRDAASFAPYKTIAEADGLRVLGQMVAHRDGNYIALDASAPADGTYSVIYHEYVHYLVRHNFPRAPRWFNEGLAEYYSTFQVEGANAVVGRPVRRHVRWLSRHQLHLDEVLTAGTNGRSGHGVGAVGNFYAGSWALVHYLLSGGDSRAEAMGEYLARLSEGAEPRDALDEVFGVRLSALESEIEAHVMRRDFPLVSVRRSSLDLGSSEPRVEALEAPSDDVLLAELALHSGLGELAERSVDRALALDSANGEAHGILASLRDGQQRTDEAEQLYREAISLGSRSPLTYVNYARHLLARPLPVGPEAAARLERRLGQARALLDEASELAPHFAEIEALRGYSYLFGEADAAAGLNALERARRRLPDRMDIVLHHAQLLMKAERFEAAEEIVEGTLRRYAEAELLALAREELERRRLLYAANRALAEGEIERGIDLLDEAIAVTSDPQMRDRLEAQLLELQRRARVRGRR